MKSILTLTSAEIKDLRTLKFRADRERLGLFLAEGEHLTKEAMQEDKAKALLVMNEKQNKFSYLLQTDLPVYLLSQKVIQQVSDTKTPQGIMALCRLPDNAEVCNLGNRVVALNAVQDPGNVGTIIRSIDAAGFTGVMLDSACADPFSPKALRASMGSVFRVPVCRVEGLENSLPDTKDFDIIAGTLDGTPFYQREISKKSLCLLIGNEGAGLTGSLLKKATMRLKLPMKGVAESLNAAVSASIMMYDFVRVWEDKV